MSMSAVKERFLGTFGDFYVAYGFGNAIGVDDNYKILTVSQLLAPPCMEYFFEEVSNYEQEKEQPLTDLETLNELLEQWYVGDDLDTFAVVFETYGEAKHHLAKAIATIQDAKEAERFATEEDKRLRVESYL